MQKHDRSTYFFLISVFFYESWPISSGRFYPTCPIHPNFLGLRHKLIHETKFFTGNQKFPSLLRLTGLTRKNKNYTHNIKFYLGQFLRPLTYELWLSFFGMLWAFALLLFLCSPIRSLETLRQCAWHFLAISLQLGPTMEVNSLGRGLLTGAWSFFSIIQIST